MPLLIRLALLGGYCMACRASKIYITISRRLLLILLYELVANRVMFVLLAVELNQVNEANRHVNLPSVSTSRNNNVGTVYVIPCPDLNYLPFLGHEKWEAVHP